MTTLTYGATTITLPDDLQWIDECTWTKIAQRKAYSITGALLLEAGTKAAGRAITLQGGEVFAWVARSTVLALKALIEQAGITLTLGYRGTSYSVMVDWEAGGFDATPVADFADPASADFYYFTLRLVQVA